MQRVGAHRWGGLWNRDQCMVDLLYIFLFSYEGPTWDYKSLGQSLHKSLLTLPIQLQIWGVIVFQQISDAIYKTLLWTTKSLPTLTHAFLSVLLPIVPPANLRQSWIMAQLYMLTCTVLAWFKIRVFAVQGLSSSGSAERGHRPEGLCRPGDKKAGRIGMQGGSAWSRRQPAARGQPVAGELTSLIRHTLILALLKSVLLRIKYIVRNRIYAFFFFFKESRNRIPVCILCVCY